MPDRPPSPTRWLAYYGELFGRWARRGHRQADSEDAIQDAALSLLEGSVGVIRDPRAYLGRSSYHKLVDAHRRARLLPAVSFDELADHQHPVQDGPETAVAALELGKALEAALLELPLKCQQVFIWNKIEGCTQQDIARRMGLSKSMVEKYMSRALAHLYDRLQDHDAD